MNYRKELEDLEKKISNRFNDLTDRYDSHNFLSPLFEVHTILTDEEMIEALEEKNELDSLPRIEVYTTYGDVFDIFVTSVIGKDIYGVDVEETDSDKTARFTNITSTLSRINLIESMIKLKGIKNE
jgi:hypothetical protein